MRNLFMGLVLVALAGGLLACGQQVPGQGKPQTEQSDAPRSPLPGGP